MEHDTGRDGSTRVKPGPPSATAPEATTRDWGAFFTARWRGPAAFISQLRRGAFRVPSEQELTAWAGLIVERKTGFARLRALLQSVGPAQDALSAAVVRLAELALRQDGTLAPSSGDGPEPYGDLLRQSIAAARTGRVTLRQREMWLTSVVLGWRKGILHEGEILELLRRVFPRRGSRARKDDGGGTVDLTADPTEVLVRSLGSRIDARALLDLAEAARANAEEAAARQAVAEELKAQMEAKAIDLTRELEAHQQEIDRLGEAKRELEHRLADLDALNADIRTTFQHRLDETRGRLRGVLGGELSRWLESAYQASTLEPPRTEVIRERLETALGAIRRELEWLQTSE